MTAVLHEERDLELLREEVRRLCNDFPDEYWRDLEPDRYPTEFVNQLTESGCDVDP
jgi:acyl-CoA dehydrogenase